MSNEFDVPHKPDEARVLKASDVMKQLKISKSQVYVLAANGTLPHYRFGRIIRFPVDAVEKLLAASICNGSIEGDVS